MAIYDKVLVALDLTQHSDTVARRASELARTWDARLCLLHVVEYVPVEPMGEALLPAVDIEQELVAGARKRLEELAERLGLGDAERRVESGNIKAEVCRVAAETDAGLVVLGSRERHGLAVIPNLAEDSILHGAPCDVLAVRLPG